ncbi:MAG: thioredoxin domain-containing protein [Candidatus Nomurabacteria bacterium]|nr:MAG: thioredoxin domain-containing protein [Candidatus Nomurabacteria bacterium]HRV76272.1 thioredoxin domain-containing protein [Candidatus Saccharimonadales bacterium]
MNKKFWIIFVVLVLAVFGYAIYSSKKNDSTTRKIADPSLVQPDDHVRGKTDSKVYLITYGDYECPACNAWEPELLKIKEEYNDRVAFIFRNFPLTDKHINAFAAARAAEAASLQGKFWDMHDLLYARWSEWRGDNKSAQGKFENYADELGLDMAKFKSSYESEGVADRINSDLLSASKIGAQGTPTFLLNGKIIEPGGVTEGKAKIRQLLDEELAN